MSTNLPSPKTPNWSGYFEKTKNLPPRPLLLKALQYVENKQKAIDIGAGALNDTRYLLKLGFDVTAIDQEPLFLYGNYPTGRRRKRR